MRSILLQMLAVSVINLKSLPKRLWLSLATVIAVGLVVTVLLTFLAMANGFQRTLAGSGADDIAVVLRSGSQAELNSVVLLDQVRLIEDGPGIAKGADGKPQTSAELYVTVDAIKRSTRNKASLPLRGLGPKGAALRRGIVITAGRMFNPGSNEVIVGKALGSEFEGFDLGQTVTFNSTKWTVVGIFAADGSVFESEIWADLPVLQSLFKRVGAVQSIRARLTSPAALDALKAYSDNDPRLKLDVMSEAAYFAQQASNTSDLIQKLGWPLAIAMAFGSLAGRDRDPAGDRFRRLFDLRRHAGGVLDPGIDWRRDRGRGQLSYVRRFHRLHDRRKLRPGGVQLPAQSAADQPGPAAGAGGRPRRRPVSGDPRRPHADRDRALRVTRWRVIGLRCQSLERMILR